MSSADLEIDDGGRAFPRDPYEGMSRRDYFAAKAMPAIIAWASRKGSLKEMKRTIALASRDVADEMIKALKEVPAPDASP